MSLMGQSLPARFASGRPDVRYAPNSDQQFLQRRDWSRGAISGREQSQQNLHLFDHLVGAGEQCRGLVRPSLLAVLRLMTSSTFVGCCTGKSAGFSPLRILAT